MLTVYILYKLEVRALHNKCFARLKKIQNYKNRSFSASPNHHGARFFEFFMNSRFYFGVKRPTLRDYILCGLKAYKDIKKQIKTGAAAPVKFFLIKTL